MKELMLVWLVLAQTGGPMHPLIFRAWPSGTHVYLYNSGKRSGFLGRSGATVTLDPQLIPPGTITLTFEHRGYRTETRDVKGRILLSHSVWPPADQPEVRLAPASRWIAVRDLAGQHPGPMAGLVGTFCLLATTDMLRRQALRRARRAEDEAIRKASTSGEIRLNDYQVLGPLGRGGMAAVYEVVRPGGKERLALKLLHREISEDPAALKRVRRELRIWRELVHPGIVALLDFGEANGRYYFVMEKVIGQSLYARLKQGRLELREAVRHFDALLEAVAYAHGRGVIHRDLKPENVMLCDNGRLKVLDFGISRSLNQSTQITLGDSVLGTPAYMAPERFSGLTHPASDQYALGLIAYEMLAGRHPIGDEKDLAVLLGRQCYYHPPCLRDLDETIPAGLDQMVMRMLAKDPLKRFASVEEARQVLHRGRLT